MGWGEKIREGAFCLSRAVSLQPPSYMSPAGKRPVPEQAWGRTKVLEKSARTVPQALLSVLSRTRS